MVERKIVEMVDLGTKDAIDKVESLLAEINSRGPADISVSHTPIDEDALKEDLRQDVYAYMAKVKLDWDAKLAEQTAGQAVRHTERQTDNIVLCSTI